MLDLLQIRLATIARDDAPLRIDQIGQRQTEDAAVELAYLRVTHDDGIGQMIAMRQLAHCVQLIIHRYAEDLQPTGPVALLPGRKARDLCQTGLAPGGP